MAIAVGKRQGTMKKITLASQKGVEWVSETPQQYSPGKSRKNKVMSMGLVMAWWAGGMG